MLTDDGYIHTLGPDLQLFDSGSTEGITCTQHDGVALLLELVGELTDGGGLPYPVHPDDHDDVGLLVGR